MFKFESEQNLRVLFNNDTLLNAINAGFFVLDDDCTIVYWNKWMEKYSRIKAETACGKTFLELFPQLENSRLDMAVQSNLAMGMPAVISNVLNSTPLPLFYISNNNTQERIPMHQHIQITRIMDFFMDNAEPTGKSYCLLHITDVSAGVMREKLLESHINERKLAEEALMEARRLAELGNHVKSQFMANISHEIRTPLNGILGMVELLKDCDVDDEALGYIDTLYNSSQSLLGVINDVLDFSNIESGEFAISKHPFSLHKLIAYIEQLMRVKANRKQIDFRVDMPEGMPDSLFGDKGRIKQVLVKLLDNAIKFTDQGFVQLNLVIKHKTNEKVLIDFIVEDSGIGISEANINKIFDSFLQADGTSTRQYGGTGLGLAISKQLVKMLGGEMNVESSVGNGTQFSFILELDIDN